MIFEVGLRCDCMTSRGTTKEKAEAGKCLGIATKSGAEPKQASTKSLTRVTTTTRGLELALALKRGHTSRSHPIQKSEKCTVSRGVSRVFVLPKSPSTCRLELPSGIAVDPDIHLDSERSVIEK